MQQTQSSEAAPSHIVVAPSPPHSPRRPEQRSNNVERIMTTPRVPYSTPPYKPPKRSNLKSVDSIANSILFEKGVHEKSTALFDSRPSGEATMSERNSLDVGASAKDDHNALKSLLIADQTSHRSMPNTHRQQSMPTKMGRSERVYTLERNGQSTIGSARKFGRFTRLEHEAKMRNLKRERECLETEHALKCELLKMKIQYYKEKTKEVV